MYNFEYYKKYKKSKLRIKTNEIINLAKTKKNKKDII